MKTLYILLLTLVSHLAIAQTPFITRWNLATAGSGATQLTFSVETSGPVSYTWQEVSPGMGSGSGTFTGSTATITGLPSGAVIDLSISPTNFNRLYINKGIDKNRLTDVRQWGTTAWTSMDAAFYGCSNLQVTAADIPNLSGVTSIEAMFKECSILNGPANIGSWNTENVTRMNNLFEAANVFNQPIGDWNTAKVTNMLNMFFRASAFNQPLDSWNTGKVNNMNSMFAEADAFNQPIGAWNTEDVTDMTHMFFSADAFNQPVSTWNVAKVTSMLNMFGNAVSFNKSLASWNTASVTTMSGMFSGAIAFNQPIGAWNTASVTSMRSMFVNASAFNQPIGAWNVTNVTDMYGMFARASAFDQPIGAWNTANVTDMTGMFEKASAFNQPIGNWNTAQVAYMGRMFGDASAFNQPIGGWNTAQVTDMRSMFDEASSFNRSLGSWKLNATVDLTNMFFNSGLDCDYYTATLVGWSANPATPSGRSLGANGRSYGTSAAAARNNLVTIKGWTITGDAASGSDCSGAQSFVTRWNLATSGSGPTQLSFGVETSGTVNYTWQEVSPGTASGNGTFTGFTATITGLPSDAIIDLRISPGNFERLNINNGTDKHRLTDVRQWGTLAWKNMSLSFYGCSNLQISAADLPNLNRVTDMVSMFRLCTILNGPANIGSWNTENVTNMNSMFNGASAFNQPIGTWNTAKVTNMFEMFRNAIAFNQPLNTRANGIWNTENVTNIANMFLGAIAFNQPIGGWNTAKVTTMVGVFSGATAFNQPIGSWTTDVNSMANMFNGASSFNQPIGNWNTATVTAMNNMFFGATAFNQPIGDWNTANVTNMNQMFRLATSFNQSLGDWTLNAGVTLVDMLTGSGQNCNYYSATLNGWSANSSTPSGRSLGASGRSYGTNAAAARTNLITTKAWTITGDAASGADCSSALPVTLVSFSGKKNAENKNTLKWITADEKDFDRFEIQRSGDAKVFETVGVVQGQGAEGLGSEASRSQVLSTYTFTDPAAGASNYYRLKMVDRAANGVDDSFEYSRIISIANSAEQAVVGSFYPNPSNGKVFVDVYAVESGSWTLTVTDPAGKIIGTQVRDLKMGMNKISVHGLSTGLNLVRFAHGQFSEVRKLITE
ncbi:BspA family leucine-rich repeat surface protein [Dyadobacter sp. 32]|uniref:BspA family leucine-rich repeat surface protein n=1 Tax=Dyadobacter sp. 32 TaxID=538966 RepID=UPI0011EEB668